MTKSTPSKNKPLDDLEQTLKTLHTLGLPTEAHTQLDDALKSLEEIRQEQADFVSTIAHELRIPLTSMMGYADLLRQGTIGEINPNQLNFLNVIRDNVERMSKLITDLSDLYKIEAGRIHLEPKMISVFNAIQSGKEMAQKSLNGTFPEIEVVVADDLPPVQANPQRIAQMVQYLLENAILYSDIDQPVTVRAVREDRFVRLMVIDRGIGVPLEDQPHIFTEFFRSEAEAVRNHKGWGLSLCVVKGLAELGGGQAGYETEPGKGSTFCPRVKIVEREHG